MQDSLPMAGKEAVPEKKKGREKKPACPAAMVGKVLAVRAILAAASSPMSAADVVAKFKGVKEGEVAELLVALEALGHARRVEGGRYAA
jgi:predicted Rossmann fold nucleotide-binding protein DprA/Smf involved in DNA uptake